VRERTGRVRTGRPRCEEPSARSTPRQRQPTGQVVVVDV
jgi:hypothetical protein